MTETAPPLKIKYKDSDQLKESISSNLFIEVLNLYQAVGWTTYTEELGLLLIKLLSTQVNTSSPPLYILSGENINPTNHNFL